MNIAHDRVSLVIPAWNEERHLRACLEAVAAQTEMPDEVFVVDNNSTDKTAEIAASFPFVKLLHEPEQGLIPARNLGFSVATGDILARIDADAFLAPDWMQRMKADFAANPYVGGLTGFAKTALLENAPWRSTLWTRLYFAWGSATFRMPVLWGANMALRREVWLQIQSEAALHDAEAHEDLDLSVLAAAHGWRTLQDSRLLVEKDGREYHHWPKLRVYTVKRFQTLHRLRALGVYDRPDAVFRSQFRAWLTYAAMVPIGLIFYGTSLLFSRSSPVWQPVRRLFKE